MDCYLNSMIKKMDLVYRGREITFEEVCNLSSMKYFNLSSMKYFSFLASFGKLAYLDLSNKPL